MHILVWNDLCAIILTAFQPGTYEPTHWTMFIVRESCKKTSKQWKWCCSCSSFPFFSPERGVWNSGTSWKKKAYGKTSLATLRRLKVVDALLGQQSGYIQMPCICAIGTAEAITSTGQREKASIQDKKKKRKKKNLVKACLVKKNPCHLFK